MTQASNPIGQVKRIDRILLGLLAVLFVATEIAGLLLVPDGLPIAPTPARVAAAPPVGALDGLGPGLKVSVARVATAEALRGLLEKSEFDLAAIRRGTADTPTFFLASLPQDLANLKVIQERKDLFVAIVLPLILHHNSVVLEQRTWLMGVDDGPTDAMPGTNQKKLLRLGHLYRVIDPDAGIAKMTLAARAELLRRVDIIPVSLALAQSAAESGWGTSRFARRGNALFGQWTWDKGSGLVPNDREEGRAHAVRAFRHLASSVRSYVHNLNISHHYAEFRSARALLRQGGAPDGTWGHILAGHLGKYSEEGKDYIDKIRSIIRGNAFGDFETTDIMDAPAPPSRGSSPDS